MGAEKRKMGAEKRKMGAEKRTNGWGEENKWVRRRVQLYFGATVPKHQPLDFSAVLADNKTS